ncbi:type III secretion system inner rod subunit SctI [Proteus mirabilis]|nr:type III secretion system inner rod subunit SctI [Proteus mirabilis]WFC28198.1 type III secretion system inner rod subunit SctI [Proteus mirabilis]
MAIAPIIQVNLTKELQDTSDDSLSTIMVNGIISSMQYEKKIQEKLATLSQLGDAQSYTNLQIELNDYSITMNLASTPIRRCSKLYKFTNRT